MTIAPSYSYNCHFECK